MEQPKRKGTQSRTRSLRSSVAPPIVRGYEIGEVIGRGAMGIVYRARQTIVDREVALKVLHPENSSQERLIQRLKREARMTARLAHPHVVSAIDMGETSTGSWWYAMEFVDGPSLALRLRQEGRLKEREALRLFIPLVEALEHLYEHGIVHRDIKPGNILIDRAGGARLADLGLAFVDTDPRITGSGGTLGTPHYISPEQAIDSSTADVRSDIWSFGATLYHTVCGRPPFKGESAAEILSAVLYMRVDNPRTLEPTLSKGMALVLRKCLTHEPANRYQTPRELLLDLERVRERRAPRVRRNVLDPVQRSQRAQNLVLGIAAVAVVAAGAYFVLADPLGMQSGTQARRDAAVLAPNAELEQLLERAQRDPGNLAQYQRDLASMRNTLAPAYLERGHEVERELAKSLRDIVHRVQRDTLSAMEVAYETRNYSAASAAFTDGLSALLFQRSGYRPEQLESAGISIAPWTEKQSQRLRQRLLGASTELQDSLGAWSGRVRAEADRLITRSEWRAALAILDHSRASILTESGHGDVQMPSPYLEEAVEFGAEMTIFLRREKVREEWRALDSEITGRVITRAQNLGSELRLGPPRIRASAMLSEWFEVELEAEGLTREKMPMGVTGVAVACLDVLDRKVKALVQDEQDLLEQDARDDVRDTEQVSAPLWRERRFEQVLGLWEETVERVAALSDRGDESWRSGLEDLVRRRREEAALLQAIMASASHVVHDLNGRTIPQITVGAIRYANKRITSGPDPLSEGFFIEGIADRIDLRALPFQQIVELAGISDLATLTPTQRIGYAAFAYHDERPYEAKTALRPDLFDEGLLASLELDLEGRVFDSIENRESVLDTRTQEAVEHLEQVFDRERQSRSRSNVIVRINHLLVHYSDIAAVRDRLPDLRRLREELSARPTRTVEEQLRTTYGPRSLDFPRLGRARLDFIFDARNIGSWQQGEWNFDGVGWVHGKETRGWEDFANQRAPRLVLTAPLDTSKFDLIVEFDEYEGPPQLVVVSIDGFHVALAGRGLPGAGERNRYLLGVGDFDTFIARVRAGEGEDAEVLLTSRQSHVLKLTGYRSGGRLRVELDGRLLDEIRHRASIDPNVSIDIRSWEPIRLRRVTLESMVKN